MAKRDQRKSPPAKPAPKAPAAPRTPAPPLTDTLERAEAWLKAKWLWVAVVVFLLSFVPRTLYFQQAKDTPLKVVYQWEACDMQFFDAWAKYIAAGNWLCDTVLHPYHTWHREFAQGTFQQYPDVAAPYYAAHPSDSLGVDTAAAYRAFVNDIYLGKVYHQEPLYPYLLAVTYKLFGTDHNWVYLWQFLMGACTVLLVFLIGLRLFGALAGLLAALVVMVSGPILVFEMVLLRTTMTTFFTALLLYLYLWTLDKPDWRRMLVFGLVSGIALAGQSYMILFLLPAWAWLVWLQRGQWKPLGIQMAVFTGGLLLALSPVFYRNVSVGVPMGALASNAAMTYIPANGKGAMPLEPFYVHQPTLVRIMHESGGRMGAVMIQCLQSFDGLADFWNVYRQKIEGMLMWYEVPNNVNYYAYKEYSPLLKQLPAPYYVIAPLGLAGILLGLWRLRFRFISMLLMTLTSIAPMVIGVELARYRTPLVVLMTLLAAWFVLELARMLISRQWKIFLPALAACVLAFVFTSQLPRKGVFPYFNTDFSVPYRKYYLSRLQTLEQENKFEEYLALTTELLDYMPDEFFEKRVTDAVQTSNEAECCQIAIRFLDMHALALGKLNRMDEVARFHEWADILRARADEFDRRVKGLR